MEPIIKQLSQNEEFGSKFTTNDEFWSDVDEIITVLQPSYELTNKMQKVGYGLADFYIGWLRVIKNLERLMKGNFLCELFYIQQMFRYFMYSRVIIKFSFR